MSSLLPDLCLVLSDLSYLHPVEILVEVKGDGGYAVLDIEAEVLIYDFDFLILANGGCLFGEGEI